MAEDIKSPCVKICKLVKKKNSKEEFCLGCGRTREEIKMWSRSDNNYKLKVLERLKVK